MNVRNVLIRDLTDDQKDAVDYAMRAFGEATASKAVLRAVGKLGEHIDTINDLRLALGELRAERDLLQCYLKNMAEANRYANSLLGSKKGESDEKE